MVLILIALVVGLVAGIALLVYGEQTFSMFFFGVIILVLVGFSTIVYTAMAFDYIAASYKAEIINREFKTQYTQEEIFWADDVINVVRELDRQRIELNGNPIRKKEETKND